jgi:hypothetical protein
MPGLFFQGILHGGHRVVICLDVSRGSCPRRDCVQRTRTGRYSLQVTPGEIRCELPVAGEDSEISAHMRADPRLQPVVRPEGQTAADEADMAAEA